MPRTDDYKCTSCGHVHESEIDKPKKCEKCGCKKLIRVEMSFNGLIRVSAWH